jgi:hypothetical protein
MKIYFCFSRKFYFIEQVQIGGKTQKLREPVGGKLRKTLTENVRTNSRGFRIGVGGARHFSTVTAAPKKNPPQRTPPLFLTRKK